MKERVIKLGLLVTVGYGIVNTIIYWSFYFLAKAFDDTQPTLADLKEMSWTLLLDVNKYLVWLYVFALACVCVTSLAHRVERR